MHTKFKSENLKGRDHMVTQAGSGRINFMYICECAGAIWSWIWVAYDDIQRSDFVETV